jgi:hypothetical protein
MNDGCTVVNAGPAVSWVEPETGRSYPLSYPAYRRTREAEERFPPRHRSLGPDVDYYAWRRWRDSSAPEVEVFLTLRPDTPPRLRRIVSAILRAIRRGEPAGDAVRHVARRFGLRHARARALITSCVGYELRTQNFG